MENYTIFINLTSLGVNEGWTDRERYEDSSGMFSVYVSVQKRCSVGTVGENCSVSGRFINVYYYYIYW